MGRDGRPSLGHCFNTVEAQNKDLPKPSSWADPAKPVYEGQIVMPNPASCGTGHLMVSAWLQTMGEEQGRAYRDILRRNIASYTHSGSKPCRQAGPGEHAIGLSFEYRANKTKEDGAPIDEPRRISRRLDPWQGWSHGDEEAVEARPAGGAA